MEDTSETLEPLKAANSGDVSDILCESLLSLFEYVDDVTKSFNDKDKNSEVSDDIVDGRLRESDGLDWSPLKHTNGERAVYCKSGEKRFKVEEATNNLDVDDLTVLYAEDDIDDLSSDSTIICKPIHEVTGTDFLPLDISTGSPEGETNELDNNNKNGIKRNKYSMYKTDTDGTDSKQICNSDLSGSDIGSSSCVYVYQSLTDIPNKFSGSNKETSGEINDQFCGSESSDNELLVTYSEVFASDDTDVEEGLNDRTVIVIDSSTDTIDCKEADKTVVDAKSIENKTDVKGNIMIIEDPIQIISDWEQKEVDNGNRNNDLNQKKRHLSSKADSEITPKRPKSIEAKTPAVCSPIQKTFSERKEWMLERILEETPIIFSKTCNNNDDGFGCVSSSPLPNSNEKIGNVRKVFWKGSVDDEEETEHDVLPSLHHESGGESDNIVKGINRRVVCKTVSSSEKMPELNNFDTDTSAVNRKENNSEIFDIRKTHMSTSTVSIFESSYFTENTTRTEGRFKNVTATISNIDLELDENLLLTEDVLGLEDDYEDNSLDEETLLADENQQVLSETGNTDNTSCYPFKRTVVLKTSNSFYENKTQQEEIEHDIKKENEKLKATETLDTEAKEPETNSVRKIIDLDVSNEVVSISSESEEIELYKEKHEHVEVIEILDDTIQEEKESHKDTTDGQISKSAENKKSEAKYKQTSLYKSNEAIKDVSPHTLDISMKTNITEGSNVSPKSKTVSPSMDMTFITEDKENAVMEEVKGRWGCEGIPSQEVNLTMATTYHDNQHDKLDNSYHTTALLEGEKISCLNFYEEELTTRHQSLKYCSAQQTRNKLRKQKQDLDSMKMLTLQTFEQNCYRRCRFLRRRHMDELENLQRRQQMEYHGLRYCNNMMPFVKQQQLVELGLNHGAAKQRLIHHQNFEFQNLCRELQMSLEEDTKQYKQEVAPVEMLISQVEGVNMDAGTEKYGPSVMVSMKKRPCKDNNYRTSVVDVCLPVVIAQALAHEEDIYNHFYNF